jgi:hypothetical protein
VIRVVAHGLVSLLLEAGNIEELEFATDDEGSGRTDA